MSRALSSGSGCGVVAAALLAAACGGGGGGGPDPVVPTYAIRGSVTSLLGSGLVLGLNGAGELPVARNGTSSVPFQFTARLPAGAEYAVTVRTQPASPSQTCTVTNGEGTVPGADVTGVTVACSTNSYVVHANVSGLAGSGLVLRNNGADDLEITGNGVATFATPVRSGSPYAVTVRTPPMDPDQLCSVTGGTGMVGAAEPTATVACTTVYTLGGTASGLLGPGLVLRNGAENRAVPMDGEFAFTTRVADGSAYDVAVVSAPKGQVCSLTGGTGTVAAAPVAGIAVRCTERHLTDGTVWAMAQGEDGTTYLGGSFTWVATATGAAVPLDVTTGRRAAPYSYVDGDVWEAAPDGAGGWYLAGSFTTVGGVARNNLAHVLANGTVDPSFDPNPNAIVTALAVRGSTVYVGGNFNRIGGQDRNQLAALTAAGGATAWNPNPNLNASIEALAVSGDGTVVYVGGDFYRIGGQSRDNLAAIEAATGNATAFRADTDGPMSETDISGTVFALAVSGNTVYAGGRFVGLGGQPRNHVGAVDAITGATLPWNPNPTHSGGGLAPVHSLAVDGDVVYAGGYFTAIGGQPRNNLAALSATGTGTALAWNPNVNGQVRAVALAAGRVVAAGEFTSAGGQPRRNLAALDATTGNATEFRADTNGYWVVALAVSGTTVFAGGDFTAIGSKPRRHLAALDPVSGEVTAWDPNPDGVVKALAIRGTAVYAGGEFANVGGQPRSRLAALDAASGTATGWNPGANASVHLLAVTEGAVYAAGDFTALGGQTRTRLGAIDTDGNATAWDPAPTDTVHALVPAGDTIYVGGAFTIIGAHERNRLAALDATTGTATAWNPNANGTVHALVLAGGTLYAGGVFTAVGGTFSWRDRLAAIDAVSGAVLPWDPDISGVMYGTRVRALAVSRGRVHVGGEFTGVGGVTRLRLASVDAATGAATSWNPRPDAEVYRLWALGGVLHVGGAFSTVGGERFGGYTELTP